MCLNWKYFSPSFITVLSSLQPYSTTCSNQHQTLVSISEHRNWTLNWKYFSPSFITVLSSLEPYSTTCNKQHQTLVSAYQSTEKGSDGLCLSLCFGEVGEPSSCLSIHLSPHDPSTHPNLPPAPPPDTHTHPICSGPLTLTGGAAAAGRLQHLQARLKGAHFKRVP